MILDARGMPFSLKDLVATRANAGEYIADFLGLLPDPDPILRKLGEDARVLADLEADDQVTAVTMARKNRVLNRQDYWFKPGKLKDESPTEPAKILCGRLVKDLESLNMRDLISGILQAPFYGLAVLEILWKPDGGWWRIAGVELKPQHWFGFNRGNELVFRGEKFMEAQALPAGKFILVRHFATYENPYGLRLLSRCLWPAAFKKGGLSFYTRFVEKFGNPWTIGYAPSQAGAAEMDQMAARLARMVRDATAVLPYGAKVEFLNAPGGSAEYHETYLKRMDAAISKVLMGNTLTSEIGDRGSYAAAETHKEVADEFAESDLDMVVTAMNELAWIYAQVNVGPEIMAPQFSYEEPEDLDKLADMDRKLFALGVRFEPKHFQDKYGLAEDEFTVADPGLGAGGFQFASVPAGRIGEYHQAIEEAVKKYAPQAAAAGEEFFSQVWKILEAAESFEELERGLAGLIGPTTEPDAFQELLYKLMYEASLIGRFAEDRKRAAYE
jgi:phage gp29-like protein